ncbi:MAG TPA: hypothetical protein PL101_09975 [Bacteroidales bacterium]|nr:hypothetical protein [Bacteroidales bacterium]
MSLDFFQSSCQESISNALFGLCDDQDGSRAYTNVNDRRKWIATVKNDRNLRLVFTAIDNCIIQSDEYRGKPRCEGMLASDEHLFFVELKDQKKSWIEKAIEQLESTIQLFIASHGMPVQRHRKAFACNKAHPHFCVFDNERNRKFFRTYGFRLDIQAEIIVV